ncbi:type II secretion system F family protein [Bradyrhizobium sp. AUGA SZCCT0169]|uniref:type II secretion system F family protein n=1 Tax=Bradyrhizobium sp. AUGA SZCCT0169 TaxID=2807663 RepID=UPI001BA75B0F|nr:type II secretion system F family protein [Bradyrhizobium sp. AUGA SZCCT0169]MBR1251484.1 type II secretion system F family protein [Bradyrhizobium sp. AUGA SZCCT0169]
MVEVSPVLIAFMAFAAVSGLVFVAGQYLVREIKVQQRIAAPLRERDSSSKLLEGLNSIVVKYFDEKRFKVDGPVRSKLRQELLRAGFFHANAINYYIFWRIGLVIALPLLGYAIAVILLSGYGPLAKLGLVVLMVVLAILGPDAYIARRQRVLTDEYATAFPDLLDLMVVCVDAGLGLEAALDRISGEIIKKSRALGMNLLLLGAETRAGRSTIDALASFADRLGLDEARAFVGTLRQSIELGSDVGDALRVFGDEMRDKRLLRAEEQANKLPVKMVIPLGTCIFPVILLVILLPVMVKLMTVFRTVQ